MPSEPSQGVATTPISTVNMAGYVPNEVDVRHRTLDVELCHNLHCSSLA